MAHRPETTVESFSEAVFSAGALDDLGKRTMTLTRIVADQILDAIVLGVELHGPLGGPASKRLHQIWAATHDTPR